MGKQSLVHKFSRVIPTPGKMKDLVLIIGSFLTIISKISANEIVVHLESGAVRGEEMLGEKGNFFLSFRGIPYAQPPIGNLRFKPPVPKEPWEGILNATKDGSQCAQSDLYTGNYTGTEDCLSINVFTPKIPKEGDQLLDVLVNIHGGGFAGMNGSSILFGPSRFPLDHALLISFNYRLSALGFLSTNDSVFPGNYGLLDQVEALCWIQKNIHHFGGDPDKVTILGDSAGGASVIYHMLSPLTRGLFQRAISMSGSALGAFSLQQDPIYWATSLAKDLNCLINNSYDLMHCLRNTSAKEIMDAVYHNSKSFVFTPTVDGYFLQDRPVKLIQDRKFHTSIPLMMGSTRDEMECLMASRPNSPADYTKQEIFSYLEMAVDKIPNNQIYIEKVWDKYFFNLTSFKEKDVLKLLAKALSDGLIQKNVFYTVKLMSENNDSKVFFYMYEFLSPSIYGNITGNVCHGNDLAMLFDGIWYRAEYFDDVTKKVKDEYQMRILNFMKHGIPSVEMEDEVEWLAVQPNKLYQFHINVNNSLQVYDETKDELYKFWNEELYT